MKHNIKIVKGALIGKIISIPGTKLNGTIIDETKNTITIETKDLQRKVIEKKTHKFIIAEHDQIEIDGALLVGKPEERIKKKV